MVLPFFKKCLKRISRYYFEAKQNPTIHYYKISYIQYTYQNQAVCK